jgi:hypothetical protein
MNGETMKIKENVIMAGLQLPMRLAMMKANEIWEDLGQELVITSALDGEHVSGSLHYFGYALDFRTRYFDKKKRLLAYRLLADALKIYGNDYRVILHDTHIHVEYRAIIAYQEIGKNGKTTSYPT